MAQLTFIIDGQVVENPLNWNQLSLSITRDQNVRILFSELSGTMNFWGGAYQLLWSKRINKCELVEYSVVMDCNGSQYTFTGNIVISDIVFNLDTCVAAAQLIDDNFQARINNNKSIEVDFTQTSTKNLDSLPPIAIKELRLEINNTVFRRKAYLLTDSLQFLVDFMTDQKVEVVSSYLTTEPNKDIAITTGAEIRVLDTLMVTPDDSLQTLINASQQPVVKITFEKLFTSIANKLNLIGGFIGNKLIIEHESYFNNQPIGVTINEQPDIKFSFNTDDIFAAVEFGSEPFLENWECTDQLCNNPQLPYFGFRKEQFWFTGNCNIDRNKGLLSTDIVYDTNVIEDILLRANSTYDENNVIIKTRAIIGQPNILRPETDNPLIGLTAPYYNAYFRNNEVSNRNFGGYIPSVEQQVINPQAAFNNSDGLLDVFISGTPIPDIIIMDNTFPFSLISYFDTFGKYLPFNTIANNPIGAWDDTTNLFTIPATGFYDFDIRVTTNSALLGNPLVLGQYFIAVMRYSAFGTFKGILTSADFNVLWGNPGNEFITLNITFSAFLEKGTKLGIDALVSQNSVTIDPVRTRFNSLTVEGSFFRVTNFQKDLNYLEDGPATFDNSKPAILEFERPLDFAQVISLAARPEQQIEVTGCGLINQKCVIKSLTIDNFESFNTKFQLMTTIPT